MKIILSDKEKRTFHNNYRKSLFKLGKLLNTHPIIISDVGSRDITLHYRIKKDI